MSQNAKLSDIGKTRYCFWPKSSQYGEPDLVIIGEGIQGSFYIPIEVKYTSLKHGEGDDDQLVNYYRAFATAAGRKTFREEAISDSPGDLMALIYVTQFEAKSEIERSLSILKPSEEAHARNKVFHLRWQNIFQEVEAILSLKGGIDRHERAIYEDIIALMRFKNLVPFSSFSDLPDGLTPTVLSVVPAFLHMEGFAGFQQPPEGLVLQYKKSIYYGGSQMRTRSASKSKSIGRHMQLAFNYVQQIYSETAQLVKELDDLMGKGNWVSALGQKNRITRDVSKTLEEPKRWLQEGSFRIYHRKEETNVRKGITVVYWNEEDPAQQQPILIAGRMTYVSDPEAKRSTDKKDWDLWDAWFSEGIEDQETDGTIYKVKMVKGTDISDARVFAIPLASIQSREDIRTKIYDKLMSL